MAWANMNMVQASPTKIKKAKRIEVSSAVNPTMGGPSNMPPYPNVDTPAIAIPGDAGDISAALEKAIGITSA